MKDFDQWKVACLNVSEDQKYLVTDVSVVSHDKTMTISRNNHGLVQVKGLWDTGSTTTIISPEIVKVLDLKAKKTRSCCTFTWLQFGKCLYN